MSGMERPETVARSLHSDLAIIAPGWIMGGSYDRTGHGLDFKLKEAERLAA